MAYKANAVAATALLVALGAWVAWLFHDSFGYGLAFFVAGLVSLIASTVALCSGVFAIARPRGGTKPWSALPVSAVIFAEWLLVIVSGVWRD